MFYLHSQAPWQGSSRPGCLSTDAGEPTLPRGWLAFRRLLSRLSFLWVPVTERARGPPGCRQNTHLGRAVVTLPCPTPKALWLLRCGPAENKTQPWFCVELARYSGSTDFPRTKKILWRPCVLAARWEQQSVLQSWRSGWLGAEGPGTAEGGQLSGQLAGTPQSAGQRRAAQASAKSVSIGLSSRGMIRAQLFLQTRWRGYASQQVGDSAGLQDQKAMRPCDAHRGHTWRSPWRPR